MGLTPLEKVDGNTMLIETDKIELVEEMEECKRCKGTGEEWTMNGPDDVLHDPCPDCNGTGKVPVNYCPDCNRLNNECICDASNQD